jgi:hypothetical protein
MPLARPLPGPGQISVGRFLSRAQAPTGPRARAGAGDYFIRTSRLLAAIRGDTGDLADLALGGDFVDHIGWGVVRLCDDKGGHDVRLREVRIVTAGVRPSLEVHGVLHDEPGVGVVTRYAVSPLGSHLEITTEVVNRTGKAREGLGVCDSLAVGNTRLQVPGVGEVLRPGRARAVFCGRSEAGLSYVLAVAESRPMDLTFEIWPPLLAFDPDIQASYRRATLPANGRTVTSRVLAVRRGGVHLALGEALDALGERTRRVEVRLRGAASGGIGRVVVQRDGKPFLESVVPDGGELTLPEAGRYTLSQRVPGAGEGPSVRLGPTERVARLAPPAVGTALITLRDEQGRPLPAKLLISGDGSTPTPVWPNDGSLHADNVIYSTSGAEAVVLAPGRYRLVATAGFERELGRVSLTIRRGEASTAALQLRRVVSSPGWISADLHVHSSASYDCPIEPAARLAAAAAVGVEVIAATDHNNATDYPASDRVLVTRGEEVTTEGPAIGHFNVFPLPRGARLPWRGTTPARLFAEARRVGGRPALIQVNHPRMGGIGYFDQLKLDAATGKAAAAYRDGYDLLEVFNGDHLAAQSELERPLGDWYALLNRGKRVVAIGGSDSHRLPYQDAGYPRNLVQWDLRPHRGAAEGREPAQVSATAEVRPTIDRVLAALRAGRTVVSTGPSVRFTVDGQPLGAQVTGTRGKPVSARVVVDAPSWVDVASVTLVGNGKQLETFTVTGSGVRRVDRTLRLSLTKDTWLAVIARGARPDETQQRKGVLPFALTNPIWVDADGDGRFTPPVGAATPASKATSSL